MKVVGIDPGFALEKCAAMICEVGEDGSFVIKKIVELEIPEDADSKQRLYLRILEEALNKSHEYRNLVAKRLAGEDVEQELNMLIYGCPDPHKIIAKP